MRCDIHCPKGSGGLVALVLGAVALVAAAVAWLVTNLVLAVAVLAVTVALGAAVYSAARWVSRKVLHALGALVVPVGYRRLRPGTVMAVPLAALETRVPLAIEAPRLVIPLVAEAHHAPVRESLS